MTTSDTEYTEKLTVTCDMFKCAAVEDVVLLCRIYRGKPHVLDDLGSNEQKTCRKTIEGQARYSDMRVLSSISLRVVALTDANTEIQEHIIMSD